MQFHESFSPTQALLLWEEIVFMKQSLNLTYIKKHISRLCCSQGELDMSFPMVCHLLLARDPGGTRKHGKSTGCCAVISYHRTEMGSNLVGRDQEMAEGSFCNGRKHPRTHTMPWDWSAAHPVQWCNPIIIIICICIFLEANVDMTSSWGQGWHCTKYKTIINGFGWQGTEKQFINNPYHHHPWPAIMTILL